MNVARHRASCVARQLQRSARGHASEHHPASEVNESFGTGSLFGVGAFFAGVLVYQFVPNKDGENSAVYDLIKRNTSRAEDWAETNALHTKAAEQAGFDRNLFENASNKHKFVDVAYPEALQSHAPRNNQAGHIVDISHVVEHYRKKQAAEDERKFERMARKD